MKTKKLTMKKLTAFALCLTMLISNQSFMNLIYAEEATAEKTQGTDNEKNSTNLDKNTTDQTVNNQTDDQQKQEDKTIVQGSEDKNKTTDLSTKKDEPVTKEKQELETKAYSGTVDKTGNTAVAQEPTKATTKAVVKEGIKSKNINPIVQANPLNTNGILRATPGANEIAMSKAMIASLNEIKAGKLDGNIVVEQTWLNYLLEQWGSLVGITTITNTENGITSCSGSVKFNWYEGDAIYSGWKFSGSKSNDATGNPEQNALAIPKLIDNVYTVYSGEQLYYALEYARENESSGITIKLASNIDLNGKTENWNYFYNSTLKGITIDGYGYTIYNLGCVDSNFVAELKDCIVKNLSFSNANIVDTRQGSARHAGIFGKVNGTVGTQYNLDNITVENSMFYSGNLKTMTNGGQNYLSPFGHTVSINARNCYSKKNDLFGAPGTHVGGGFARANDINISNSFSIDSNIIAVGEHSGGFISCSDISDAYGQGTSQIKNCFTNNNVYGNKTTGVFIGAINAFDPKHSISFENCYSSGTLEGTDSLGGFVSSINQDAGKQITFKNCYSTSIVGMQRGGKNLGGFIGSVTNSSATVTFTNCYAAGEVGGIDTDVTKNRATNKDVGGFIGSFPSTNKITYDHCYYDKQTTAMREWESGTTRDAAPNISPSDKISDDERKNLGSEGENDINGLRGVLTSDSEKSGAGLASKPNKTKTAGFLGFNDDSNWIFDGRVAETEVKHNCMYPQINLFSIPIVTDWGEYSEFVKVYSYASVSTVHENVWDNCVNPDHSTLNTTTYDTVRDLTSAFTMTSYADLEKKNYSIEWKTDDTKTMLYNEERSVIDRLNRVKNDTWNRNYYRADKFSPGIEWLTVKIKVGESVGTRRLRIIPNANLKTGKDSMSLVAGDTYNHADDMAMAYSTGPRMAASMTEDAGITTFSDVTQATYPSSEYKNGSIVKNVYTKGSDGVYNPSGTGETFKNSDVFKKFQDTFSNVSTSNLLSTSFMDGADGTEHTPNNYLRTKFYKITNLTSGKVDSETGAVEIDEKTMLEEIPLLSNDGNPSSWGKKITGKETFEETDAGRYLIEYVWVLPDARYIKDSKMIYVKNSKHTVKVNVVDSKNKPNSKSLLLAIDDYQDHALFKPDFSISALSTKEKGNIPNESPITLSYMRAVKDDENKMTSLKIEYISPDGNKEVTISDPQRYINNEIPIVLEMQYFFGSYEADGKYYVTTKDADREYYIKVDTAGKYYYTEMNNIIKLDDNGTIITRNDIDNDIVVTITIDPPIDKTVGTLNLSKVLLKDGKLLSSLTPDQRDDKFAVKLTSVTDTSFSSTFILNPQLLNEPTGTSIKLTPGKYTIEEIVPMNYDFTKMTLSKNGEASSVLADETITITGGDTSSVVIYNTITNSGGVKGGVTNELERK